jgi:hypothetical protein
MSFIDILFKNVGMSSTDVLIYFRITVLRSHLCPIHSRARLFFYVAVVASRCRPSSVETRLVPAASGYRACARSPAPSSHAPVPAAARHLHTCRPPTCARSPAPELLRPHARRLPQPAPPKCLLTGTHHLPPQAPDRQPRLCPLARAPTPATARR